MSLKKVNNTFIFQKKEDLEIEVGDIKQSDFRPRMKIKRWDNEVNFSVGVISNHKGTDKHISDRIEWDDGHGMKARFYEKSGDQFEFDIILDEKPLSNVISMSIEIKGLDFFYQPPLTQEYKVDDDDGRIVEVTETHCFDKDQKIICHRPDDVVGSYAVYHGSMSGDYHSMGGKNYMNGKAFHIYRPIITDSVGKEVFGKLDIDVDKDILSIEIPHEFLDAAIYPIIVDPTFGYTSDPGTSYAMTNCIAMGGTSFLYTASTGDTITKFSIYGKSTAGATGFDAAVYDIVLGLPKNRLDGGVTVILPVAQAWADSAGISQAMSDGVTYCAAFGNDGGSSEYVYYDSGTGNNRSLDTTTDALPSVWSHSNWSTSRWGVYATYSEGAPPVGHPTMRRWGGIPGMQYTGRRSW